MFGAVGEKTSTWLLKLYSTCPEKQTEEKTFLCQFNFFQLFWFLSLKFCKFSENFSAGFQNLNSACPQNPFEENSSVEKNFF